MIKIKLKFLVLVSVSINVTNEINWVQKDSGNLLPSRVIKEQMKIQSLFAEKISKELSSTWYFILTTLQNILLI